MAGDVFDKPEAIGEIVWSSGWREDGMIGFRVIGAAIAGIFGLYGFHVLVHHTGKGAIEPLDVATALLMAVAAFLVLAPDRHCMCLGKEGFSISVRRYGFRVTREVLRFADADDVEVAYTRIVSDGVYQLYTRTDVVFAWLDRQGDELAVIEGRFDEPEQRAAGKWMPDAPVDLSAPRTRDRDAKLGYAAVDWFHAFKDQRDVVPYR